MRGSDHASIGAATAAVGLWLLSKGGGPPELATYAAVSGAAAIGALAPDIDHPKSLIGNGLPLKLMMLGLGSLMVVTLGDWLLSKEDHPTISTMFMQPTLDAIRPFLGWAWIAVGIAFAMLLASTLVSMFLGHRGPTHSLLAACALTLVAILTAALNGWPWTLGLWFGWGYLTHLITDAPSPMGLPALLWPLGEGVDLALWNTPARRPMTRPGAKETVAPSRNTSADACPSRASLVGVEDLEAGSLQATLLEPKPSDGHDSDGQDEH